MLHKIILSLYALPLTLVFVACSGQSTVETTAGTTVGSNAGTTASTTTGKEKLLFPGEEKYLKNVRQLTFGGQNAEAYFSQDGQWLIFQSQRGNYECDEQYVMRIDGSELRKVSTGKGRVTCGYFFGTKNKLPAGLVYASTHDFGHKCPAKPDYSRGYVWPIYPSYELYTNTFKGDQLRRLTKNNFYDAEATVSPNQKEMVYTSTRDGDLDLYIMNVDGTNNRRITTDLGYDGGAFFSHDGKKLIYRAYHPETEQEKKTYKENLKNHVYRPSWLELFIIDTDGKNKKQITNLRAGSFAPFLFPNNKRVIFSSNKRDQRGRGFDLYAIDLDGKNLEQITFSNTFDAFPMFSPDGKYLVWASNRNGKVAGETNIFIAEWVY